MGHAIRKLYSSKDSRWENVIRELLDTLAARHIYFEFLRLDWLERQEQAWRQEHKDIVELMPHKKISHIPSNIQAMQEQVLDLWTHVLDILSPSESIPKKMVSYSKRKERTTLNTFRFEPQPVNFEAVDDNTFTDVLHPKDIYDLIDFFIRSCIKREQRFRVCKNCGKYFALLGYINMEYCDRPYDAAGRTCKEIGALHAWEKKKAENPALKAYSKAYKKRFAWIKYGKMTKETFYAWSEIFAYYINLPNFDLTVFQTVHILD